MSEIYIVVKCGHEGIASLIRGFINPKDAITLINQERAKYDNPSRDDVEFSYYFYLLDKGPEKKEQVDNWLESERCAYCIQRDSGNGFECVCKELGVSLGNELWLY